MLMRIIINWIDPLKLHWSFSRENKGRTNLYEQFDVNFGIYFVYVILIYTYEKKKKN